MRELARPIPRPAAKSKVLVVRQPIKSVRPGDHPDRLPLRLAIGVITAIGIVALIWLLGHVGFRLGFAQVIEVTDLRGELDDGLIAGVIMLIKSPALVIKAGIAQPLWLMLGFLMIAVPAGGLAAARPRVLGGPNPRGLTVVMSNTAAVLAMINAALLVLWMASTPRLGMLRPMPLQPAASFAWLRGLQTAGGLDVLAFIAAALWVVLVMRLLIPLWLRGLSAAASFFALAVVSVGMAISTAAATQVETARSLAFLDDGSLQPRLLLGETRRHVATLVVRDGIIVRELLPPSDGAEIIGRQSIIELLKDSIPREAR